MKIVGYADRFGVRPNQTIRFMISSELPTYKARIIRLRHTDANPSGPGFVFEAAETAVTGEYPGKPQPILSGSYAVVPHNPLLDCTGGFSIAAWVCPTTPRKGVQGLVTKLVAETGYGLFIEADGSLGLWLGGEGRLEKVRTGTPLKTDAWVFVAASYDGAGQICLLQQPLAPSPPLQTSAAVVKKRIDPLSVGENECDLVMAACWENANDRRPGYHFNGRVDNPRIFNGPINLASDVAVEEIMRVGGVDASQAVVASWDFSIDIESDQITDTHIHGLHGLVMNLPTRAVTGHNWTGDQFCFSADRSQYGAIHFHDDDLEDAGWEVGFEWDVPDDWPSGAFAAHISNAEGQDYVPFFVTPKHPREQRPQHRIAFLASTLSYLVYANQRFEDPMRKLLRMEDDSKAELQDQYMRDNRLLGCYDLHSDGSGVCYSSRLRPIMNFRPLYRMPSRSLAASSPRHLNGELHLLYWMDKKGFDYDVLTDDDLHWDGSDLLNPYNVVVTSTHPEYWTAQMLNALESYQQEGGRLMYLGGNGFYWVTSFDPQRPHIAEVRRSRGVRTWEAGPGEQYHSTTGEMGGLWRYRNREPQKMVGVGFTSQGSGENRPYERQPDSFDPRAAFIFEGVGEDEPIGDFPSLVLERGAAGFEIDRFDRNLGTPDYALLLASAAGYTDLYQWAIEDQYVSSPNTGGTNSDWVRSDMVYFDGPNGGAVFSVGSISWCSCLSYNDGANNVSRITENVLRRFSE